MSLIKALFNRKRRSQNNKFLDTESYDFTEEEETDEELDPGQKEHNNPSDEEADRDIVYEVVEREIQPAKIICPDCGGITLEGLEFCDKCGGELL